MTLIKKWIGKKNGQKDSIEMKCIHPDLGLRVVLEGGQDVLPGQHEQLKVAHGPHVRRAPDGEGYCMFFPQKPITRGTSFLSLKFSTFFRNLGF